MGTSYCRSGCRENCGDTRLTFTYNDVDLECSVPTGFSATHSYLPMSSSSLWLICKLPPVSGGIKLISKLVREWRNKTRALSIRPREPGASHQVLILLIYDSDILAHRNDECLRIDSAARGSRAAFHLPSINEYRGFVISTRFESLSQ